MNTHSTKRTWRAKNTPRCTIHTILVSENHSRLVMIRRARDMVNHVESLREKGLVREEDMVGDVMIYVSRASYACARANYNSTYMFTRELYVDVHACVRELYVHAHARMFTREWYYNITQRDLVRCRLASNRLEMWLTHDSARRDNNLIRFSKPHTTHCACAFRWFLPQSARCLKMTVMTRANRDCCLCPCESSTCHVKRLRTCKTCEIALIRMNSQCSWQLFSAFFTQSRYPLCTGAHKYLLFSSFFHVR